MNLITLMENERETIVAVAAESLSRSHLVHYEEDGLVTGRLRLERVFDITLNSIKERTLIPVIEHAHRIAEERFRRLLYVVLIALGGAIVWRNIG